MSHHQLLRLGFSARAIKHRVARGRLHPIYRGVYAVGTPDVGQHGRWMAAVLACGESAALSHGDAAALYEIRPVPSGDVHVVIRGNSHRRHEGIVVHRRPGLRRHEVTRWRGIPVTSPICTLIDIAPGLSPDEREAAVNEADNRGLVKVDRLRRALDEAPRRPGVGVLKKTLDRHTFARTESWLERRFLRLAQEAGLPKPLTQQWVNGFRVDFYWPELDLVVETDGLTYHRTPAEQANNLLRDHAHAVGRLIPLRFSHFQVAHEPEYVRETLANVARR